MKIIAIVECENCSTYEKTELKEGFNVVSSCKCGNYFGDEGGKVTIEKDRSY